MKDIHIFLIIFVNKTLNLYELNSAYNITRNGQKQFYYNKRTDRDFIKQH